MYNNTTACLSYPNICHNLNNDEKNHSASLYMVTLTSTMPIASLSPVAVVGNALVLAAIWRNPSLRTPSYILLAGLAFTDLSTRLIAQPFYVAMELIYLTDPQLKTVDNTPTYLTITAVANGSAIYFLPITMCMITVMSVELWLHMTRRSVLTVRRLCYTVAGLFLLPIAFVVHDVFSTHNNTIYLPELHTAFISFSLFCFIVTSTAYIKVFRIIRSHQHQIQANNLCQASGQPGISFAKYKKSVFTVLYILAIFYISFLPHLIAFGLFLVFKQAKNESMVRLFFKVTVAFLFLSSSLNPILYLWRMSDIRTEVTSLVKGILCKGN